MTIKQIVRLINWLKSNQFSEQKIIECIEYIANEDKPKGKNKKPVTEPTKTK